MLQPWQFDIHKILVMIDQALQGIFGGTDNNIFPWFLGCPTISFNGQGLLVERWIGLTSAFRSNPLNSKFREGQLCRFSEKFPADDYPEVESVLQQKSSSLMAAELKT